MSFKLKFYFIILFQLILGSSLLNATINEDAQALSELTSVIQNLSQRAVHLGPIKPSKVESEEETSKYLLEPFRRWDEKDYSVIQIQVLDQFLTVEEFLKQKSLSPAEVTNQPNIFKHPEEIESLSEGHGIRARGSVDLMLNRIQKARTLLKEKNDEEKINPLLNIGGGEESCGYHAIKNALFIIRRIGYEPGMFLILNDPIEANKVFGTYEVNKLLDIRPFSTEIEEGPWRKAIKEYRITVKESSISNLLKATKESLKIIEENSKRLPELIESFKKSIEKEKIGNEIKKIWEIINTQEQQIASESNRVNSRSKKIDTAKVYAISKETSNINSKAKDLLTLAKESIPDEIFNVPAQNEEYSEPEDYSDEDEENDNDEFDVDEDEDDYSSNGYSSEEEEEKSDSDNDEEPEELKEKVEISENPESSLNLKQSKKGRNFLKAEEIDFIYEKLNLEYGLPESTTVGAQELGIEPTPNGDKIDPEITQQFFDHIINNLAKDKSKQHVVFIAGGSHWASIVIRIINNKLYYIIADSTNELRYGVDLKQKGIFITKSIQKIIDGTKDSLLKLIR